MMNLFYNHNIILTMKKLIIAYLFIFFISSCSSTSNIAKNTYADRPFLNEYKTFYLTYGVDNPVFDISLDASGKFAYISKEDGGGVDIFAIDTYTLKQYRMTKNPSIDSSPSINKNNKYLTFSSTRNDAYGDIYLFKFPAFYNVDNLSSIDVDSLSKRLTYYKGLDSDPEIAREKNIVAFTSDRWNSIPTIHLVSLDGEEIERLTDIPSQMPTFSFDDESIAFISMNKETDIVSQLAIVNIDTKQTKILTDSSTFKFNPSFYNDDIILYFEAEKDTDNDKTITYADKKRLIAYSISENQSYIIEESTDLTSFFMPYASSTLGAFVDFKNGSGNASIGNTKTFFIKDAIATNMYNTFLYMPYNYKKEYIDKFDEYFTNDIDKNIIAQANFDYMITSYVYNEYEEYLYIKHKILQNYTNTQVYDIVLALEKLTAYGVLNNSSFIEEDYQYYIYNLDMEEYRDIDTMSNALEFLDNNPTYNSIWARYIASSELAKYNVSLIKPHSIMEKSINLPIDTRTYINMVKLYSRLLLDDNVPITDIRYSTVFVKSELSFSQTLDIAKATIDYGIEKNKINLDFVIEEIDYENPLAMQARLAYIDSLIITGNVEYAKSLFTPYASGGNGSKAIMNYGLGKIESARNNTDMYIYFENAVLLESDFNNSIDGKFTKEILANYYLKLANEFYENGEYVKAYNNYVSVLKYDPDDSTASQRRMETSLHVSTSNDGNSLNSISSVEKMVFNRIKFLLENRYSDPNSHLEIATSYYYLANKYYSYAIQNAYGNNRYLVQNKRRQDGFSLYLLKAFNTIINEATSAIDIAIFLEPKKTDYYIFKAQMLATAMTMRIEIKANDKKEQSLLDLVASYQDDVEVTPNIEDFSRYQMYADTLEYDILAALIEAKRHIDENYIDSSQLSLMLANAYLINGLYVEATEEYEKAQKYIEKSSSKKEKAWYNFFYGYSLWINGYIEESIKAYELAYEYFNSIDDIVAKFRVLGYLAIANIDEHEYFDAIRYLKEREILLTKNNEDTSLNDLLLSTCYLKNKNYSQALTYCDKAKPYIDNLDPLVYDSHYITISVFGSVVPIVDMGLAAFGGYIPDEPLNIDKKEMLYSLYQEIYEEIGNYPSARHSLDEYRKATENDETKKSLKPLFLSMYKNNEGALYYLEGDEQNAISSFDASIKGYEKLLGKNYDPNKNVENDAINYINLTYIYLNTIADAKSSVQILNKSLQDLATILPKLESLSVNTDVNKKNRFLLHTNIAAINYIFAKYSANMFKDATAMDRHDNNMRRIIRIKDAINGYKYVLSSDFEVDTRTEVILRYNLGLCFDFAQNINEAAREYTTAYSKANQNNYPIEEIGILSTMLEFSKKYHKFNKDIISPPDVYAKRIYDIAKNNLFSFSFYPQSRFIILIAKNNLISYYGTNNIDKVIEVATLFDAITARIEILKEQKLTFNDNNTDKYLKEYYSLYNRALLLHNKYTEDMAKKYDKNVERKYIDKINDIENEARKKLQNSSIKEFALGAVDSKTIQKKLLQDETLIWDLNFNIRLLMNKNKVNIIDRSKAPTNLTRNVTHIGFMQINNISYGKDTFYRWILFSSPYIIPNTHTLFDINKYSVFVDNKATKSLFTYSSISNTNTMLNISSAYNTNNTEIISNIINSTNTQSLNSDKQADYINEAIYSNYMNYNEISKYSNEFNQLMNNNDTKFMNAVYSGDLVTIEQELIRTKQISFRPKKSQFVNLTNAMDAIYIPFVLDLSDASKTLINRYANKSPYIVYSDKKTFSNYSQNILELDPYVVIIGKGNEERAMFYTNYISQLMTNSVANVMRGSDPNKYRIYGLATLNANGSTDTINNYQKYLFNNYISANLGRDRYIAATNLINFLDTTNKKIHYYTIISEEMLKENNTNASKTMLDLAYKLFVNSSSSNIGNSNAMDFMLKAIPLYRSFNTNEIYTNAYRMMHYISNYGGKKNYITNVVNKYMEKQIDMFRYISKETDSNRASTFLDLIIPNIDENYKYKDSLYEYAIVYKTLYANEDLSNSSYILDKFYDKENLIKVLNTLREPIDSLTDEDVFFTMNYLYAKPMVFKRQTVNQFANKYFSLYKTNAPYIFGLLEKRRYSTLEFSSYIKESKEVFDNEKWNSLFCFYTIENDNFVAYVYSGSYTEVKRYNLGKLSVVNELINKYKSFTSRKEREDIINDIQKQIVNREMMDEFNIVENIYITGNLYIYEIPFMFFKFADGRYFGEKNISKIRRIKYADNNDFINIKPTVEFIENQNIKDDFYLSLEKTSVLDSFKINNNNFDISHYIGYTNNITNYINNNFLSPSTRINMNNYLKNKNNGALLFTHTNEHRGDYYITIKELYKNLKTNNIIKSYQNTLFNNNDKSKDIKPILPEDNSIRYGSYMMFDYILPYVPKYEYNIEYIDDDNSREITNKINK